MNKEELEKLILRLTDIDIQTNGKLNDIQRVQLSNYQDMYILLKKNELLQEENQKLKEQVKDEENWRIKIAKENERLHKDCLAIIQQRDLYNSVIDEIDTRLEYYLMGNMKFKDSQEEFKKIMNILDKAKVGDISE